MSQYRYRITMERVPGADGVVRGDAHDSLCFEADNHDDLFGIVKLQQGKAMWAADADTAAQLAVGLKMFAEVALHHRNDPLFEPLMLPLREFIGRLKSLPAAE